MSYLKYAGAAPIMNSIFGEFKKGELKLLPENPAAVEAAKTMAREQPYYWVLIERETHKEKKERNKLDRTQSYFEKNKNKGGKDNGCTR